MRRKFAAVIWQLFFELVGFLLSLHITRRDPDVQRRLRSGSWPQRLSFAVFALVVLGLLQVIHVKRAWARQLRNAEVLESLEDQDYMWTTPVLGAERGLPVAIVTNIPAVPVVLYAFLLKQCFDVTFWSTEPSTQHSKLWWCEPKSTLETCVLGISLISSMLVLSICVVDLDIATSAFVARRYDMNRSALRGKRPMQMLYPAFHILFRVAEVVSRITLLCSFLALCAFHCGLLGVLTTACICLLDLVVLLMILQRYSPDEALCVQLLVASAMLVTDAAKFVDRPGFCYPANCISRAVDRWHRVHFLLLATIALTLELTIGNNDPGRQVLQFIRGRPLAAALGVSVLISEVLKLTVLKVSGDDLHTAMLHHRTPRVRKLLEFSLGGEVLDVNGPTKDSEKATASMLAASSGFVEGLRMIMACGGKVEVRNSKGESCIHFAVRHLQLEALEFLVNQPGANKVLRNCREELLRLAVEACGVRTPQDGLLSQHPDFLATVRDNQRLNGEDTRQLFLLLEPERGTRRNMEEAHSASSLENVRAHLAMSRHLHQLFGPNAQEEHAPELHELHSVSALLVAHSTGTLARLLLQSQPAVGLEQLKRVRTLGQGASGTVIEVEYEAPMPTRSSLRLRLDSAMEGPKRFAMKLQSKRNMHLDWQAYSEVVALRRCRHPFIVRLEQAFQTPHYYALLLELCPNGDVNQLLCCPDRAGRYPGLPLQRAAKFAGQVLLALAHLHEEYGIVYRDVKPKNVLLSAHDEAKLADFGLALYVGKAKCFSENDMPLAGTPSFWAPELILGVDGPVQEVAFDPFKTDAYSFGVTLLLMLLGEDCADVQADDDECMWMIPRSWQNDEQREADLSQHVQSGRLLPEALDLLDKLLTLRQSQRSRLANPEIRQHAFFLNALNCQDLKVHLLGEAELHRSSVPEPRRLRGPSLLP